MASSGTIDLKIMECPVCFKIPPKEVYQCLWGHVLCKSCAKHLKRCPLCRKPLEVKLKEVKLKEVKFKVRNVALEGVIDSMKVECEFKDEGCHEVIPLRDLHSHLEKCPFRPINFCQVLRVCSTCNESWKKDETQEFYTHLITAHPNKLELVIPPPMLDEGRSALETSLLPLLQQIKEHPSNYCAKLICFSSEVRRIGIGCNSMCSPNESTVGGWSQTVDTVMNSFGDFIGYQFPKNAAPIQSQVPVRKMPLMAYLYKRAETHLGITFFHFEKFETSGLTLSAKIYSNRASASQGWIWKGNPTHIGNAENELSQPRWEIPLYELYHFLENDLKLRFQII